MLSQEENERLTQVGPGTPGGELLRRYWHPVAVASELTSDQPKKRIRVLGEDLVLYRIPPSPTLPREGGGGNRAPALPPEGGGGNRAPTLPPEGGGGETYGLVGEHCSHRAASLYYGFLENGCIRCPYHGWLYDAAGKCIEQPFEPAQSMMKHSIRHPAYPVEKLAGLLFAYLGPPERKPLLPHWDMLVWKHGQRTIELQETLNCSWVQAEENSADYTHTYFLHAYTFKSRGRPELGGGFGRPFDRYGFQPFKWGVMKSWVYGGKDGGEGWGTPLIFPNILWQPTDALFSMHWRVPIDDTHTEIFLVHFVPSADGQEVAGDPIVVRKDPQVSPTGEYAMDTFFSQDKMAWETQGPVLDRTKEHLGASDRGIVMFREMLKEAIDTVRRGGDPIGLVWDPAENMCIDVEGWTTQRKTRIGTQGNGLSHPLRKEDVFDERHAVFEVPYGAARPLPAEPSTPSAPPRH